MNDRQRRAIAEAARAAGIPRPVPYVIGRHRAPSRLPCQTCETGPYRETVGMVCQACGTDYAYRPRHKRSSTR